MVHKVQIPYFLQLQQLAAVLVVVQVVELLMAVQVGLVEVLVAVEPQLGVLQHLVKVILVDQKQQVVEEQVVAVPEQ
jgi:hypothetical protein